MALCHISSEVRLLESRSIRATDPADLTPAVLASVASPPQFASPFLNLISRRRSHPPLSSCFCRGSHGLRVLGEKWRCRSLGSTSNVFSNSIMATGLPGDLSDLQLLHSEGGIEVGDILRQLDTFWPVGTLKNVIPAAVLEQDVWLAATLLLAWAYLTVPPGGLSGFVDFFYAPFHALSYRSIPPERVQVGRQMGQGSFGIVYKGFITNPNKSERQPIVLKRVKPRVMEAVEMRDVEIYMNHRLQRTAPGACAEFIGTVRVKESQAQGKLQEGLWLVWKYQGDRTLEHYMKQKSFPANIAPFVLGKQVKSDEAASKEGAAQLEHDVIQAIMVQLLGNLQGLHQAGVVHRDIKPANLILALDTGCFKLIDLGACVDLRSGHNYVPNETVMDPKYAAPEKFVMPPDSTPHPPPDPFCSLVAPLAWLLNTPDRFDIYSVGVIFMQLCVKPLRSDTGLVMFNEEMKKYQHNLDRWRKKSRYADSEFALLDADGGAGWDLARSLLRPRPDSSLFVWPSLGGGRPAASTAARHRFIQSGNATQVPAQQPGLRGQGEGQDLLTLVNAFSSSEKKTNGKKGQKRTEPAPQVAVTEGIKDGAGGGFLERHLADLVSGAMAGSLVVPSGSHAAHGEAAAANSKQRANDTSAGKTNGMSPHGHGLLAFLNEPRHVAGSAELAPSGKEGVEGVKKEVPEWQSHLAADSTSANGKEDFGRGPDLLSIFARWQNGNEVKGYAADDSLVEPEASTAGSSAVGGKRKGTAGGIPGLGKNAIPVATAILVLSVLHSGASMSYQLGAQLATSAGTKLADSAGAGGMALPLSTAALFAFHKIIRPRFKSTSSLATAPATVEASAEGADLALKTDSVSAPDSASIPESAEAANHGPLSGNSSSDKFEAGNEELPSPQPTMTPEAFIDVTPTLGPDSVPAGIDMASVSAPSHEQVEEEEQSQSLPAVVAEMERRLATLERSILDDEAFPSNQQALLGKVDTTVPMPPGDGFSVAAPQPVASSKSQEDSLSPSH